MPDNNTGVLVALIGFGIAAVMIFSGGSGGSSTSSGATSRDDVLAGFAANQQSLIDQMEQFASQSSGSSSSSSTTAPDSSVNDPGDSSTWEPGFAQQIVERTGYLPDGFDAAGRIAQLNRGNTVGL
ncbi:hypothetical protein [Salinigranum marinum]|uniref:hypothetical protein n=1 Tax=Salinigranum marinum TaxID=1515595 RepID=UPI002989D3EA|nr:hypothetical protein [Salinigranum marinum]